MTTKTYKEVLAKIQESKVTIEDFNKLISETTPESIRDRIRRRTLKSPTKSHIDNKTGHQSLSLPSLNKRVMPKRKPVNQQNHGRSRMGQRHSQQAQRYMQEAAFIQANIGKPIDESKLISINVPDLLSLASRLLVLPNVNRDWIYNLISKLKA